MEYIAGFPKPYVWGSTKTIPEFLGEPPSDTPVAELWFGAHPQGSAKPQSAADLRELIASAPETWLGPSTIYAFGEELPYLLKLIAPDTPLSLQVHPSKVQAQAGFLQETEPAGTPMRVYHDANHKPELLYAIDTFDILAGFAVRRQVRSLLEGLDCSLARRMVRRLRFASGKGMRSIVTWLLDDDSRPHADELTSFAGACEARLTQGTSPAPLLDTMVTRLYQAFPTDPGVAVAFLMNPVQLSPGEAIYIPPGMLHSYQSGFGLEVMANSDNVIRAGLTEKHVDTDLLIDSADFEPHPVIRLAPEKPAPGVSRFFAPVEDFELTVADLSNEGSPLVGEGPRMILCLNGDVTARTRKSELNLRQGQCVFVGDTEGPLVILGTGTIAQCSVP